MSSDFGDWDIRAEILAGRSKRLLRNNYKAVEEAALLIRLLQKAGHNITQRTELYEMSRFNPTMHMCPQCLIFGVQFSQIAEKYYPLLTNKAIMVNGKYTMFTFDQSL